MPVTGVYEFTQACTLLVAVAVGAGFARADDVAHAIWASRVRVSTPWVIVVEDDVDPFNLDEVVHALVTKCHPGRGIVKLEHSREQALLPFLTRHEQRYLLGARAYFDCPCPPDWALEDIPKKCTFKTTYPSEIQEKALTILERYGY